MGDDKRLLADPEAFRDIAEKVKAEISSFNERCTRYGHGMNYLSLAQMLSAAIATAIIAANIHYRNIDASFTAIFFSSAAALTTQLLQYFKFQDRLQIAVATVCRLSALRDRMSFDRAVISSASDGKWEPSIIAGYFETFEKILNDANQAWAGQIQGTHASRATAPPDAQEPPTPAIPETQP
ncbi:MAG: hypothetical protein P4L57_10330 [Rhizomicrobium sp.]|nr:hypothetical protein [Rhizomicrobium sp.]